MHAPKTTHLLCQMFIHFKKVEPESGNRLESFLIAILGPVPRGWKFSHSCSCLIGQERERKDDEVKHWENFTSKKSNSYWSWKGGKNNKFKDCEVGIVVSIANSANDWKVVGSNHVSSRYYMEMVLKPCQADCWYLLVWLLNVNSLCTWCYRTTEFPESFCIY